MIRLIDGCSINFIVYVFYFFNKIFVDIICDYGFVKMFGK